MSKRWQSIASVWGFVSKSKAGVQRNPFCVSAFSVVMHSCLITGSWLCAFPSEKSRTKKVPGVSGIRGKKGST